MANILLIENNKELENLYNLNFRVYLGLDPLSTSKVSSAVEEIFSEEKK